MDGAGWILLAFLMGSALTLIGVLLGGVLVFKTKREQHEAMFRKSEPAGSVGNIDTQEFPSVAETEDEVTKRFEEIERSNLLVLKRNKELQDQLAGDLQEAEDHGT